MQPQEGIAVVSSVKADRIKEYENEMAKATTEAERENWQRRRDFWKTLTKEGEAELTLLVDLSGQGRGAP